MQEKQANTSVELNAVNSSLNEKVKAAENGGQGDPRANSSQKAGTDANKDEMHDAILTVKAHEQQFGILNQKLLKTDEKLAVFGEALDDL